MMYISAVSAVLYETGLVIDNKGDYRIDIEFLKIVTINLQFAGGFITVFFWVSTQSHYIPYGRKY